MSDYVSVQIRPTVYEKLRRLAILSGDVSSAVEKLIAHWEGDTASPAPAPPSAEAAPAVKYWHSGSGDVLPIGATLRGKDMGKPHEAVIEHGGVRYNGVVYPSLSAAGSAVKHARGLKGKSANTDGRKFWRIRDPKTNQWAPINSLRPPRTAEEMLRELEGP